MKQRATHNARNAAGLTFGSFCSGIGAPEAAWLPLGWSPKFFSEIEAFPSAVLAERHPSVPNLGDMTAIDTAALPDVDLWVAGTPCQAFSVAGLRRSLADDRGNLTLTFCRMIHERDPRIVVWENVPGVLSTKDNAFGCFLAGLVGEGEPLVCGDGGWRDAGMAIGPRRTAAWRVLDAQYFGLAQRRRRVFVVSFRTGDGLNPGAVLFEPDRVPRDSAPGREAGAGVAGSLKAGSGGGCGPDDNDARGGRLIPALTSRPYADNEAQHDKLVPVAFGGNNTKGSINVATACRAKGGSGHGDFESETFVLDVAHNLRGEGFDASEDGTGRGTPLMPIAFYSNESHSSGSNVDISPTLRVGTGLGIPSSPAVAFGWANAPAQTMRVDETAESLRASPNGYPATAYTIHGTNKTVRVATATDLAQALRTRPPGHQENSSTTVALSSMALRRLTPRECERLQGFPDDFTAITYRGKPAADGPRYKALGNSMAVPVLAWIGRRIEAVLACEALANAPPGGTVDAA